MSLLADLLSKIKPRSYQEGDVPPGLKRTVSDSSHKEMLRKRIVILSSLLILAIVAGVVTVYVMDMFLNKPSVRKQSGRHEQAAQVVNAVKPEIKTETEKAQAPAQKSEPAAQKVTVEPMPKPKKGVQKKPAPAKVIKKPITSPLRAVGLKDSKKAETDTHEAPPAVVNDSQRDMYIYTARTFESRKDYAQALFNYKKALESDPNNYIIMSNISSALLYLESYEEAIRYAMNALNIKKDYVPSLINLGIASIRLNNLSEGESYLLKALSIEPANRHVLFNTGLLFEKRQDFDKANEYFLRLSEKDDINGYLGAARIAEKQGRASDAVRIYKEIFSMNNVSLDIRKLANDRVIQLQPPKN